MVVNALGDMHTKSRSIEKAHKLLYKMHDENIISWSAMIIRYAQNKYVKGDHELI